MDTHIWNVLAGHRCEFSKNLCTHHPATPTRRICECSKHPCTPKCPAAMSQSQGTQQQQNDMAEFYVFLLLNVDMKCWVCYSHGIYFAFMFTICIRNLQYVCRAVSWSLRSDPTCVGDGMLLPVGVSGGEEGRGRRPSGDSWFTGCSGDKLQLLSSSHDEFSPKAFGNCVSERREEKGCGKKGEG